MLTIHEIQWVLTAGTVFSAMVLIVLEKRFPYNPGQDFLREGFFNDFVFYNLLQSFILGLLISNLIEFIDHCVQVTRWALVSPWPLTLQFLFFFIAHDIYIYWFHRFQHHSKYFWRLHEAHHSTRDVDWLSGARSHALEILINQTIEFAPIILLGAAPEIAIYKGAVDAIWGMYIHSNIDVRSGKLQYILNGPEMHRWHHSSGHEDVRNKNFSTKLAVWDWVFGTAYFPTNKKAERYGLDNNFPKNYFIQQLFAFRSFKSSL